MLRIRAEYRRGRPGTSYLSLANEYDVSGSTVGAVLRGVTWRHLLPNEGANMPKLDKWQQRQAQEKADAEDITYEHAVAQLFPDEPVKAEETSGDAVPEGDAGTPPKVSTSKTSAK